ncbi:MAG: MerR family transcriptional regulator [Eubacteriales bacterium]|nr:MerR family transcriptional regulator [Eubacteriales bacterium]
MSKYTTGELAKICDVSVRTVQYYDTRGILIPSELTDGGRRIYSEEDLKKMKAICLLRELDIPINSIKELLSEEHPEKVISVVLSEQKQALKTEIAEKQARYDKLEALEQSLKKVENFSVESIGDIAHIMANKKNLHKMRTFMSIIGVLMGLVQMGMLILWITKGVWLPFVIVMSISAIIAGAISSFYYKRVAYICPECHSVFRPAFKEFMFAKHTPSIRKLTCTDCKHTVFCVETYGKEA